MADVNVRVLVKAIDNATGVLSKVGATMQKTGVQSSNLQAKAKALGGTMQKTGAIMTAAVSAPLIAVGLSALKTAADFEQTQVAFTTMLGSAELARAKLKELAGFAKRTPFELRDVEKNAKLLLAMGAEVDNIIPEMKMLGDVSAGLSVPLSRIALNFGQVRLQGKLTGRELRDFAVLGVPIIDELSASLGKSREEITQMVSEGKIGFKDVKNAFISMTSEGGKFNNLMQAQSKTTAGQFSNLKDEVDLLKREIGKELLPKAIELIKTMKWLVEKFRELSPEQKKVIMLVGVLAIVLGPLLMILGTVIIALTALGTVLTGPIVVAVAVAVAAIIGLIAYWGKLKETVGGVMKSIKSKVEGATKAISKIIDNFKPSIIISLSMPDILGILENIKNNTRDFLRKSFGNIQIGLSLPDILGTLKGRLADTIKWAKKTGAEHLLNFGAGVFRALGFQKGGIIPGPLGMPQLAVVHGGERIEPAAGGRGGGTTNITFNFSGYFLGSENEMREFAKEIWVRVGQVASAQNKTPEELLSLKV